MFHGTVEVASVAYHVAAYTLDAGLVQEGFPLAEEVGAGDGDRVFRGYGRVAAADYVKVAVQGSVFDDATVAYAGNVLEIRAEEVDGHAGGDEFHRRGRNHALVAVPAGQGVAAFGYGKDSEDGRFESLTTRGSLDVALGLGLDGKSFRRGDLRGCRSGCLGKASG